LQWIRHADSPRTNRGGVSVSQHFPIVTGLLLNAHLLLGPIDLIGGRRNCDSDASQTLSSAEYAVSRIIPCVSQSKNGMNTQYGLVRI
jgi:hypothetical protein